MELITPVIFTHIAGNCRSTTEEIQKEKANKSKQTSRVVTLERRAHEDISRAAHTYAVATT